LAEGVVRPDEKLLFPKYYLVENLKEWMEDAVSRSMSECGNWMA